MQEVGFNVLRMEAIFVIEELESKFPMVDYISADQVLLGNAIKGSSAEVLAYVASDVQELAASFEAREQCSISGMTGDGRR